MTASPKTRYPWIDLAKAISITLIVWFHCPPKGYNFTLLSIPVFFFLSGLLFDFEKYVSFTAFIKHRSRQLLVPYFCFFFLFYLFWLFVGRGMSSPEEQTLPLYAPLLEYLYGRPSLVCMPLWFIACLFSMQCGFYLFKKVNKAVSTTALLLLPFLPCLVDLSASPWMLDEVCFYIPFYGIACLFKKEIFLFLENKARFSFAFISLIISILSAWLLPDVHNEFMKTALTLLCSFSSISTFLIFVKTITDRFGLPFLIKYTAANTIIILACHSYAIRLADVFISRISGLNLAFYDGNYLIKLGMTIAVMAAMFVPICIINKYFPFMVGKGRLFKKVNL